MEKDPMQKPISFLVLLLSLGVAVAACSPVTPPVPEESAPADVSAVEVDDAVADTAEPALDPTPDIVDITIDSSSNFEAERVIEATSPEVETYTSSFANRVDPSKYEDLEIITLLPPDAIPAINNPTFHDPIEANEFYEPDELVIGVVFNGDARAYSIPHLSSHEIVNDEVGGVKIAVTW